MINKFTQAINKKNVQEVEDLITKLFYQKKEIDKVFYPEIEKLLIAQWHNLHEEILGLIWLRTLKDDRFIEPIMKIAKEKLIYRRYDDELESTLRKCVHALKIIESESSKFALKELIATGNANVSFVIENYK